jgi:glycosyltransferase involved in cell wall biosynthesis
MTMPPFGTETPISNYPDKRILWIGSMVSGFNTYQTSLIEILNHLEKRGYSVTLFGTRPKNPLSAKDPLVKTIFIPLKYKPAVSSVLFNLITAIFLPFYIAFFRPAFVFFQPDITALASVPAKLLSKATGTKFVLDIRSIPVEITGFQGFLQKLGFDTSVNVAKRLFSGITIITPPMKEEICLAFKIDSDKVGVWTSGVSTMVFNPETYASDGLELRRVLGLNDKFVVFYHGALSVTRGILETTNAIKYVKSTNPDIVLFLLGSGSISGQLEELVKKEQLEKNVIIRKPVPYSEVPKYIAMSDVCISPLPFHQYWRFQSPLKLLEYMAMQKSIILTTIPAHKAMVGDEKCGLYISSTKPEEIAKAIHFAYENRHQLDAWGKTGRRRVTEKYTWEKVAKDLDNYLEKIKETAR